MASEKKMTWIDLGVCVYSLSAGLALLYFQWRFVKTHTFTEWLTVGTLWTPVQAALWPFFIFLG